MSRKLSRLSIALAVVLGLAACSGHKDEAASAPNAPSLGDALSPDAMKAAAEAAKDAALPQPDADTPESSYVKLTSGNQLMFLYAANSGLSPDFDRMAEAFSSEYRGTRDSFRKRDLLTAITPKLQANIAQAKAHPYVIWDADSPALEHYDFQRKGFTVGNNLLGDNGFGYFYDQPQYQMAFSNGAQVRFLPVAEDALARKIEANIGSYKPMHLRIFGFVQSTDDSHAKTVKAAIVKVQVLDNAGRVLIEQRAPAAS